jgi:hypothetical protein
MTTSLFAAQEAVYAALSSSAALQGMIGNPVRLYDVVPPAAAFPYVTLGDVSARDYDTKDRDGFEQMVVLHAWSRGRGRKELKNVMQAVYDILHRGDLGVTGADFVSCRFQSASTQQENDGLTLHGVMRFRIIVQH